MLGLRATAANKGNMRVIGLAGNKPRSRFCSDKRDFANQVGAPGPVDAVAQFALHALDLTLPGLCICRYFEKGIVTSHRSRMRCESFPRNRGPSCGEPRERRLRAVESPDNSS